MKRFTSIEKIDTGILYMLELTSSVSVLLLAFGLIASMANVLTEGSVLTDNLFMQRLWAWTQCIAIDASVAGTIIRTFRYHVQGERVKAWLNGLLSVLLLFTAAIVSNIESVQQTLNLSLSAAYVHVFIPVEALIWIRSIAIVLLIVAHALRHVQHEPKYGISAPVPAPQPTPLALTPELIDALRSVIAQVTVSQVTVSEETAVQQSLPSPQDEQGANAVEGEGEQRANTAQEASEEHHQEQRANEGEQREANNFERVRAYLAHYPEAKDRDIADALTISTSTANKWRKRVSEAQAQRERR